MKWWGRETDAGGESAELLRKCRKGDEAAWSRLYRAYKPLLIKESRRWGLDRDVAEEIAQESFLRLVQSIGEIREPRAVGAFLRRTSQRLVIDRFRRASADKRGGGAHEVSLEQVYEEEGIELAVDSNPSPSDAIEDRERRAAVIRALASMSPDKREILHMRFICGHSYEEIARATGVRKGTLTVRVNRYLKDLRRRVLLRETRSENGENASHGSGER